MRGLSRVGGGDCAFEDVEVDGSVFDVVRGGGEAKVDDYLVPSIIGRVR
jgi:hypothetical protein